MGSQFTILLPTLNEADNIRDLMEEVMSVCSNLDCRYHKIIVVDGGSTDQTEREVEEVIRKYPDRIKFFSSSEGDLSHDILAAAQQVATEAILVMDSDYSFKPKDIPEVIKPVLLEGYDVAIGSRYLEESEIGSWPFARRLLSFSGSLIAKRFVEVKDPLSGFFSIRRDLLLNAGERASGFKILFEVLTQTQEDLRIKEIPISYENRRSGNSELSTRQLLQFLKQIYELSVGWP